MELFTASYRAWQPALGCPVRSSLTAPRWITGASSWPQLWPATPRWAYFDAPADEFAERYMAQLDRHGAREIARRLAEIARSGFAEPADRLVLLCYESTADQCHRGLFADWWLTTTGEKIAEVR